jgi:hypothetical protein
MSFLSNLLSAVDTPVVQPIAWPDTIEATHPIRSVLTHIRMWPTKESLTLQEAFKTFRQDENKAKWVEETYFWVIALGLADASGSTPFTEMWQENATEGKLDLIDYNWVGQQLRAKFDGPIGLRIFQPLWNQIMELNGFLSAKEATDAKNSERIETSTQS